MHVMIYGLWLTSLLVTANLYAKPLKQRIPDEFESVGGHALGFGNGGSAASSDLGSIRSNPAMIAIENQYTLSASYHWPSVGREFYQAGAVDSKTSPFAAGVSYTAARDKYQDHSLFQDPQEQYQAFYDSPIKFRVAGAIAQPFSKLALGLGGQFVEGYSPKKITAGDDKLAFTRPSRGATIGFGLAGLLSPSLRFGASVENLANRKVKDLAPTSYRAGLAYTLLEGNLTLHGDYVHRERVQQEKAPFTKDLKLEETTSAPSQAEQLLIGSFSVRIQDLLRILGAFGEDLAGSNRRLLAGGIALVNNNFSLSYLVSRPYLGDYQTHQAVNLSLQVSL